MLADKAKKHFPKANFDSIIERAVAAKYLHCFANSDYYENQSRESGYPMYRPHYDSYEDLWQIWDSGSYKVDIFWRNGLWSVEINSEKQTTRSVSPELGEALCEATAKIIYMIKEQEAV